MPHCFWKSGPNWRRQIWALKKQLGQTWDKQTNTNGKEGNNTEPRVQPQERTSFDLFLAWGSFNRCSRTILQKLQHHVVEILWHICETLGSKWIWQEASVELTTCETAWNTYLQNHKQFTNVHYNISSAMVQWRSLVLPGLSRLGNVSILIFTVFPMRL